MNESQIDLSCDPAKLDTEVCTVVGDQAALRENATGSTKKSLQQAFDLSQDHTHSRHYKGKKSLPTSSEAIIKDHDGNSCPLNGKEYRHNETLRENNVC